MPAQYDWEEGEDNGEPPKKGAERFASKGEAFNAGWTMRGLTSIAVVVVIMLVSSYLALKFGMALATVYVAATIIDTRRRIR